MHPQWINSVLADLRWAGRPQARVWQVSLQPSPAGFWPPGPEERLGTPRRWPAGTWPNTADRPTPAAGSPGRAGQEVTRNISRGGRFS